MRDLDRRKTAVPIVKMNDVGRRTDAFDQGERRRVEKSKSLVIFRVAVYRIPVKIFGRVNQIGRRTVDFLVNSPRPKRFFAPFNPQIVNCRVPEILGFGLPVARRDQERIFADGPQSLRQRARDIA